MTALTGIDMRNIDKAFALTNRLRTEGTEHLLAAANGKLLIAQSFAGWPCERTGGPVKTEADPLDPDPPKGIRETHAAIRRLERLTTEAGGIVLRYGGFYGPGTGMAPDGEQAAMIRKRQFPLVGNGAGVWSFLHTDDLATATLAAIERGRPGEIYNIVDDEPAPAQRVAAVPRPAARGQAAAQGPEVGGEARREPGRGDDDDRIAGRVQRQGEGRAGVESDPSELA